MIDPNAPAYPTTDFGDREAKPGMAIRATMAMHAMMAITATSIHKQITISYEDAALNCCKFADALIAELNKTEVES